MFYYEQMPTQLLIYIALKHSIQKQNINAITSIAPLTRIVLVHAHNARHGQFAFEIDSKALNRTENYQAPSNVVLLQNIFFLKIYAFKRGGGAAQI